MKVFAVIAPAWSEALDKTVTDRFPGQHYPIAPGQYLVAVAGLTAREVGERIGDKGEVGRFFVLPFEGVWGWHGSDMWSWAQSRMQA